MIEKQKSPQQRLLGQRENGETVRYCNIDAPAYGKSCQGQRRLRGNYNAYDNPVAEIDFSTGIRISRLMLGRLVCDEALVLGF